MPKEDPNDLSVCESLIILTKMPELEAISVYLELKTCWDKDLLARGADLLSMVSRAKYDEIEAKAMATAFRVLLKSISTQRGSRYQQLRFEWDRSAMQAGSALLSIEDRNTLRAIVQEANKIPTNV